MVIILPKPKNLKRLIPLAAAVPLLVGSFLLPNAVASVMDARRLDNLVVIDAQRIAINAATEMSMPKRISLAASSNTEVMPLVTGQTMDMETAETAALRELSRFFDNSIFRFIFDDCVFESGVVSLVIDIDDPAANILVWEFKLTDRDSNTVTATIDDETGMILKIIYQQGSGVFGSDISDGGRTSLSDDEMNDVALRLAKMLTDYYGLNVRLSDYQYSSTIAYYKAILYSNDVPVPMYGVVRSNNFTINERL